MSSVTLTTCATSTSAIILAGGEGRRVGGQDKGLLRYKNKTLIEHVISRISPQVDDIVISANRNTEHYQSLPCSQISSVNSDETEQYLGPLSGIASCLPLCKHSLVLVVACDMPLLPANLLEKLLLGMHGKELSIATVNHRHQLALLLKQSLLSGLQQALSAHQLKLIKWVESCRYSSVNFDDNAGAFRNFNKLEY